MRVSKMLDDRFDGICKILFFCFSHTSVFQTQIYKYITHLKIATIEYNLLDRYIVTKSSVNNLGIRTGPEETNTFNTFAKGRHVILLE
jgi:hypothetical protein